MQNIRCNLCNSLDEVEIYNNKDGLRVVMCGSCSLVYLNPRLSEKDFRLFYQQEFQDKRRGLKSKEEAIERLEQKGSYEQRLSLIPYFEGYIDSSSNVLEIGCGWGTLLKVLKDKFGCKAEGVEPSSLACQVAREYYKLEVFQGNLNEYLRFSLGTGKRFDFIMLSHVLEHLIDPSRSLVQLRSLLNDGGAIYMAMPDISNPSEKPEDFFHKGHCHYFSPKTVILLLIKSGFKPSWLKRDFADMKMIVAPIEGKRDVCEFMNYIIFFKGERVRKIVNNYLLRYRLLKKLKNLVLMIIPGATRESVIRCAVNALKKLKIIKV
ncbi:class I SAM-dependent methyltransferase [Patescibacteria group bacterium]|nr:class I SAM-dependent methyltransferase [Patescibacteria group bacterium]